MIFFQVVGMLVTAWFAVGLVVGVAYVVQHTAMFFSAGFRWGAAGQAALLTAAVWPAVVGKVLRGSRGQREDDERRHKEDAAELMESHRHALRQGEWYRDVLGIRRKWFVDAFGREYSPEQDGPTAFRVWEKDYPCNTGEWTSGECPLCAAPEKGSSACGMKGPSYAQVPKYEPDARLMRTAPPDVAILAVSNPGSGSPRRLGEDTFHVVSFRPTGEGKGVWVDARGEVVDGLLGWWPIPRMSNFQSSDGIEEPHRWLGENPPPEYDSRKAWDEVLSRPGVRVNG